MQAIWNEIIQNNPDKVIIYLPATKLIDEIILEIIKKKLDYIIKYFDKKEIDKNLNQITLLRKSLENDVSDKLKQENIKIEKAKKEARQIILDAKEESSKIIKRLNQMDDSNLSEANKLRSKDIYYKKAKIKWNCK